MGADQPHVLVVGGTGFIGRHVVDHARVLGWTVTTLSLRASGEPSLAGVTRIAADIGDQRQLAAALSAPFDYVVNCAGYIDHAALSAGGRSVFDVHLQGLVNLVSTIDRQRLRGFVNLGSSDEYGNGPAPQRESQREAPISPYSAGKLAATHFLQMLFRTEQFPAATLRLFLTYGPGQGESRFLPQVISGCLRDATFPVSTGEQLRDFCFVQDTVDGVFGALTRASAFGEVINIGSGQPVSIRRAVETTLRLVGSGNPKFGALAYRPGESMALYPDISKAKALLDWEPKVSFEDGLQRTIDWFRDQR